MDDSPKGTKVAGAGNVTLLVRASAQWLWTILVYAGLGVVVSWLCFMTFAVPLWATLPAMPAARAGGFGALVTVIVWLLQPAGFVTVLYVVGFPAGFAVLGHALGLRAAVGQLVRQKVGGGILTTLVEALWPAIARLDELPAAQRARGVLRRLSTTAGAGGLRRRILEFGLSYAKVPELLATAEFAERSRAQPEQARAELVALLEQRLAELTRTPRWRLLALLLVGVVVLTWFRFVWLGWLGVAPS